MAYWAVYIVAALRRVAWIFREEGKEVIEMQYMIEPIGAEFSNRDLTGLAGRFNSRATEGSL
jgi:hypothetical protein